MAKKAVRRIVSNNIRRLREARGLTQEDLGKAAQLSGRYISQIESSAAANLTLETIEAIADVLEVEVADLVSTSEAKRLTPKQAIEFAIDVLSAKLDKI